MNFLDEIKNPKELLDYMSNNIAYGFVGKNGKKYLDASSDDWYKECFVQSGEEVLESKVGTCWDQVELERLWFENNSYKYKTYFLYFDIERENELPTHTFLIYEKDNKFYWFENAFEDNRGIHEFKNENEVIEYVKEKQIEYIINNKLDFKEEDKKYLVCCEYSKPPNHLGVEEYLKFVTKRRR